MRKLFLLFLLIGITANAQIGESTKIEEEIVVGRAFKDNGWQQPVTLAYTTTTKGRRYRLYYQDEKYLGADRNSSLIDVRSISFYATEEELEYLYNFLLEGLDSNEKRKLDVGEGSIFTEISALSRKRTAVMVVNVLNDSEGMTSYFRLSKKTLDRVFAK